MDAECAGNRRKLIFTKYLHQVSYLFNACVHLISVIADTYVARPFARIGARSSRYVDTFILAVSGDLARSR